MRKLVLYLSLLGLFQVFFYLIDFYPLYIAAKVVFPLLVIAFTYILILTFLLRHSVYPHTVLILGSFAYLTLTAAAASNFHFSQPVLHGVTAEIKLLGLLFYFPALYLLRRLRVSLVDLGFAIQTLAWVSIIAGLVLELFVDPAQLISEVGIFVKFDDIRGYRYNVPLIFVVLHVLIAFRKAVERRSSGHFCIQVLPFLAYLILIAEQRLVVLGLLLAMLFAALNYSRRVFAAVSVLGLLVVSVVLFKAVAYFGALEIGGALAMRLHTAEQIFAFMGSDTLRWLFGAGALNPLFSPTIQDLFGQNFWPSDVGWVGILFEFGLFGVLVIGTLYYVLWRSSLRHRARTASPALLGLKDFTLMTILLSLFVPTVPYLSGVYATVLAIFKYAGNADGSEPVETKSRNVNMAAVPTPR